jgi:hypothetical protein
MPNKQMALCFKQKVKDIAKRTLLGEKKGERNASVP